MKYKINELFRGKFPNAQNLYDQLVDLQNQIDNGADAKPIVKKDVKLNKTSLKKAFGDPSKFDALGIVHNAEGSYLVVANDKSFMITPLENI
jgi:hypothetical protein